MEKRKDSFILYNEYYEMIKELPTDQKGLLLCAIFEYSANRVEIELPTTAKIIFKLIKKRMDYDSNKYVERCQQNAENVRKRWNKEDTNEYERIQKIQPNTKHTDIDNDMIYDNNPPNRSPLNVDNFGDNSAEMDGRKEEKIYIGEDYHVAWDDRFQVELRPLSEGQIGEIDYWLRKHFLGQEIPAHIIRNALITKDQRENKQVANA